MSIPATVYDISVLSGEERQNARSITTTHRYALTADPQWKGSVALIGSKHASRIKLPHGLN
jgi:hypothetical protein